MKLEKLTQDQKKMIKLFQSMAKLQQYKTIRGIIREGVLDRVNEINMECMTESCLSDLSGKYTPPSTRFFSMFSPARKR